LAPGRLSKGKCEGSVSAGVTACGPVPLPWGCSAAVYEGGRLVAVEWERTPDRLEARLEARWGGARRAAPGATEAGRLLLAYGRRGAVAGSAVAALPLAWDRIGAFDAAVLQALLEVPPGRTITYGELAAAAGYPRAGRAAGGALRRNPWPVLVPCHRVVPAQGAPRGFTRGPEARRALLEHERPGAQRSLGG